MIRLSVRDDIDKVNVIRKEVHSLHVKGEGGRFKPNFDAIKDQINDYYDVEDKVVYVCEESGDILGYIMCHIVIKEETAYRPELRYIEVSELGVREGVQGRGIGRGLIDMAKTYAREMNVSRVELNMWDFNEKALGFYSKLGFRTYRRYMEIDV